MKRLILLFFILPAFLQVHGGGRKCPIVRIVPERLPDMNVPRSGHNIFFVNDELTVAGGHTTHFVPTQTAEYLSDGKWHLVDMAYAHDNGMAVVLQSGEVFIAGGHVESLGIGQSFNVERYHPQTHTFEGFGCLDRRRVLASAMQLGDGRVIISGNHYDNDAIACYDGRSQVQHVKAVRQNRSNPYILPIASGDAVIFSGGDWHMQHPDTMWVDRLKGDAFRVPLLEQWKPVFTDQPFKSTMCAMGNHSYLLTVVDKSGQLGFVVMHNTTFSLLPTSVPVPMHTEFGPIFYKGPAVVDNIRQRGYVIGVDSVCRHQFVLAIDYAQRPAALTLYQTDSMEHATVAIPILTPDGDLLLVGGEPEDNYKPLSTVWCYHFASPSQATSTSLPLWLWVVMSVVGFAFVVFIIIYMRGRKSRSTANIPPPNNEELLQRLCHFLEHDQRYLQNPLRLSDIAIELDTSVSSINASLTALRGITFTQLIAEYRVHHAQQLLAVNPDMKLTAVISQSGFTSESTFFRTFKAVTGMSPKEWLSRQ